MSSRVFSREPRPPPMVGKNARNPKTCKQNYQVHHKGIKRGVSTPGAEGGQSKHSSKDQSVLRQTSFQVEYSGTVIRRCNPYSWTSMSLLSSIFCLSSVHAYAFVLAQIAGTLLLSATVFTGEPVVRNMGEQMTAQGCRIGRRMFARYPPADPRSRSSRELRMVGHEVLVQQLRLGEWGPVQAANPLAFGLLWAGTNARLSSAATRRLVNADGGYGLTRSSASSVVIDRNGNAPRNVGRWDFSIDLTVG
jgi:hypothetical protein